MSAPRRAYGWLLLALLLSLFQITQAVMVLQLPAEIAAGVALPMRVTLVMSVVWGGAFLACGVAGLRRYPQAPTWIRWLSGAFIGYSLLRLGVFSQADYDRMRLPFLLIIAFIGVALWLLGRAARQPDSRPPSTRGEKMGDDK